MKRETINNQLKKFIKDFERETKETIDLISSNLSQESKLNKEDISNILIKFLNKGGSLVKANYTCPLCQNQDIKCPSCDALINELKSK